MSLSMVDVIFGSTVGSHRISNEVRRNKFSSPAALLLTSWRELSFKTFSFHFQSSIMANFGFENRVHCPRRRPFWVVYKDLSIDFGRTVLFQNRDMACNTVCGLLLSLQQQRDASSEMLTVYSLPSREHCSVTVHQGFRWENLSTRIL